MALTAGVALGSLAVLADSLPLGGRVVILVASTGLAWGAAAVLLGAVTRRPWQAAVSGTIVLLAAVLAYYGLIGALGTRPAGAGALSGAAAVWGFAALVGGPVAGACGWYAGNAAGWSRAAAWGGISGLLLAQAAYLLARNPRAVLAGDFFTLLVGVLVGVPVLLVLYGTRGRSHRPLALSVTVLVAGVGGLAWAQVMRAV